MERLCKSDGCSRRAYEYTNRKTGKVVKYALCNPCRQQAEKSRDLAGWAYRKLKSNVKARRDAAPEWKKPEYAFEISEAYFRQFCYETEILNGRGVNSTSLHIDRIVEELGYVEGNIRPLSNRENVLKEWARRRKKVAYVSFREYYGENTTAGGLRIVEEYVGPPLEDEEGPPF